MKYKIDKQKCTGCGMCVATCPGAVELGPDGKAKVTIHEELEKCGGEKICPFGAIEKVEDK